MSAPEPSDVEYICVGICLNDPESGLGCGRPPRPGYEPKTVADEASRYPVAGELFLPSDHDR